MKTEEQIVKQSWSGRAVGGPAGFRELLQRLGPTFVKMGQFLALRPDLVPQEYCDELMKLLDRVPPFPWPEAKLILKEDLGIDHEDLFAYVNPRPVAAGSLAQVHFARLKDGSEVALKIQRPNIRDRVLKDLRRARLIAQLLDLSGVTLIASPREIVQELGQWMMQEIDFRNEMENMARLRQVNAGMPGQRIPRSYPELSSARVLTAEYLRGVSMSEILKALQSGTPEAEGRVKALGVDRDELAANLFSAALTQIFRFKFFHGDLHPGNLLVLPGNVIGFVDFGLCGQLDETVREKQFRYMAAVYADDRERMFDALLEILVPSEKTDIEAFRSEFYERTSAWRISRQSASYRSGKARGDRSATGTYLIDIMRSARRHELRVPARVLQMYRTLLTAEAVASQLRDRVDLGAVAKRFFANLQIEEMIHTLEPKNLQPILLNLFTLVRDSPGQFQQVLSNLAGGRLNFNVEVSEAHRESSARNQRSRLVVAAIISVGVSILLSSTALPMLLGISLRWTLFAILIFIYVYIMVQWRRLG
jgi:ubiquinone biosynthesis protein